MSGVPSPTAPPASHPAWAEELRRRYVRGEASQFVLHGNVFDLVEHGGELLPVQEYLTQRLLSETKDVIVAFNVSTGGRIVRRKANLGGLDELLLQRERAKFLPAMERVLKTVQKVALIIEYAETIAPAADPALMSDDDRSSVVTLHRWSMAQEIEASDSVVLLLAENLSELHPKLVSNPKIATVRVPMPDEATRLRVISSCQPNAEPAYAARLAAITAGLRAVQIQAILQPPPPAGESDEEERARFLETVLGRGSKDVKARARKLATLTRGMPPEQVKDLLAPEAAGGAPAADADADADAARRRRDERDEVARVIARRKREIIERECFGLIEFVEAGHDFRVVGGIEGVKAELQRIATAIREGNTDRVPMGLLFTGPMGAGKTFVAEAFAKESGLTAIKLKNFRSKWVGATEGNLERILQVVQAIGQVLVIIDEGDRAFGSGSDGEGDGGTSSRVIARIKEFMSDTSNRGRILFILMTNRPDKLDVDIKRAGRLDKKIPLLYAQTPEEVEAVALAQLRKHRLQSRLAFPADRAAVSQPILGMSNADFEAIVLLAAEIATSGDPAAQTISIGSEQMTQAIADYLPSRDSKMLEFMELLAVFEASNRKMLPKKYENMRADELQARLEILRLECWQPEVTMDFSPNIDVSALQAEAIARGLYAVALVDGVHERELALIADFYQGTASEDAPSAMVSIERAGPLEPAALAQQLAPVELRELFVKAAFLLAFADGKISPGERTTIGAFAKALEVTDATQAKLEAQVKDLLLRPLANLANVEAVSAVAKKLGV